MPRFTIKDVTTYPVDAVDPQDAMSAALTMVKVKHPTAKRQVDIIDTNGKVVLTYDKPG